MAASFLVRPFTHEEKSDEKENAKPKRVAKSPDKKEVGSTQISAPFLSPLIRKHMKRMGSEVLYSVHDSAMFH